MSFEAGRAPAWRRAMTSVSEEPGTAWDRILDGLVPEALGMDETPPCAPSEVVRAIAQAGRIYDELELAGRRLHFDSDPITGRLAIHIHDLDGRARVPISAVQALNIATGVAQ